MAVVDASIWVALFQENDVFHKQAKMIIQHLFDSEETINVPAIVFVEVSGAIRRRTGKPRHASHAIAKMHALNLEIRAVDEYFGFFAADITARLGMRGADALYVALAKEVGEVLYTFDQEQITRGGQEVETRELV
jgi:predicted nucleic acid-binding protein